MTTSTTTRSILAELRRLAPRRAMYFNEALRVAELQANRLLEIADVSQAPVPTELIADLPRIFVELHDDMPVAGSAHWHSGRWVVRLAADDHPRRQRFSLAHEFKHVLDHPARSYLYNGLHGAHRQDQIERIADAFAAYVLMPKRLVCQAFFGGIQDPHDLARRFEVSPAAMRFRLSELGLSAAGAGCGTTWRRSTPLLSNHVRGVSP